jgi:DNA-directed RNA polymerase II subunit RPB2
MDELTENDIWKVTSLFLDEYGLVSNQLLPFNDFLHEIPFLVSENGKHEVTINNEKILITFSDPFLHRPGKSFDGSGTLISPFEVMLNKMDYSSEMTLSIRCYIRGQTFDWQNRYVGNLPIMVNSELCNRLSWSEDELISKSEDVWDHGGYFIINGKRKNITCQEVTASNKILIYESVKKSSGKFKVKYGDKEKKTNFSLYAEMKTIIPRQSKMSNVQIGFITKGPHETINVSFTGVQNIIPIGVIFKALGIIKKDVDIYDFILSSKEKNDRSLLNLLIPSLEESYPYDQDNSLLFIHTYRKTKEPTFNPNDTKDFIAKTLLTQYKDNVKKGFFIGMMVNKLIKAKLDPAKISDRDMVKEKRQSTVGDIFTKQFVGFMNRIKKNITKNLSSYRSIRGELLDPDSWLKIAKNDLIMTKWFVEGFTKNKWEDLSKKKIIKAKNVDRFNYISLLTNMRKAASSVGGKGKTIKNRFLNQDHYGIWCPYETPEGADAGLIRSFALDTYVTVGFDPESIIPLLRVIDPNIIEIGDQKTIDNTKILVNGLWLFSTSQEEKMVRELRGYKRNSSISHEISITSDPNSKEIKIYTDPGRVTRVSIIAENGMVNLKRGEADELDWKSLISNGKVEFIDKEEEDSIDCAVSPITFYSQNQERRNEISSCYLHPSLIMGVGAALIPCPNHNQAPRNTYQSSMSKQSIGIPGTNYLKTIFDTFHEMMYPQKPLVSTEATKLIKADRLPSGQTIKVLVAPLFGLNQEDSILLNKKSVERGMLNSQYFVSHSASETSGEVFEYPPPTFFENERNRIIYSKIDPDSYHVKKGVIVRKNDIVISVMKYVGDKVIGDASVRYEKEFPGEVFSIVEKINNLGSRFIFIHIVERRIPIKGDKAASRSAQKGICAAIVNEDLLPFSLDGDVPDLVINPLAYPSRMTIAQFLEPLIGEYKTSITTSNTENAEEEYDDIDRYGTPFVQGYNSVIDRIGDGLERIGLNRYCEKIMFDGLTGEPLQTLMFFGPITYQRLKHMVEDKVYARSAYGSINSIMRQPKEGRNVRGGLRIGYMEDDCLRSQSAIYAIKDRMNINSDPFVAPFCSICGLQAVKKDGEPAFDCALCKTNLIDEIDIPFSTKAINQFLGGMGLTVRVLSSDFVRPRESCGNLSTSAPTFEFEEEEEEGDGEEEQVVVDEDEGEDEVEILQLPEGEDEEEEGNMYEEDDDYADED